MTYLDQTPGAHLIYDVRKHIFPCSYSRNAHCQAGWTKILSQRNNRSTWKHGVKPGFAIS